MAVRRLLFCILSTGTVDSIFLGRWPIRCTHHMTRHEESRTNRTCDRTLYDV